MSDWSIEQDPDLLEMGSREIWSPPPIEHCYDLGYHVASGLLVRIPSKRLTGCIPPGCVRVVRYREPIYGRLSPYWVNPYLPDGTLGELYRNHPRAQDIEALRSDA